MGLKEILGVDHGKNIMFVTHQVLTGAARCYLEQRPLSEIWNGKLVPGGYFKFALNDNKISEILSAVVSDQWSVNNKLLVTGH
jgi:broad specificity phosphatase PhoE